MSEWTDWDGCYEDGWGELIVGEAYAHPAKFRAGLIGRIYKHGLERGWLVKGDVIGDPFGGIGGGAIYAAYNGLRWVGVELEPKFVELFEKNVKLHSRRWENGGDPIPVMIQGDSRKFAELVSCSAIVTSPPYATAQEGGGICKTGTPHDGGPSGTGGYRADAQGQTPGNIGNLKAIVTSPPYAGSSPESNSKSVDLEKQYETYRESGGGASFKAFCATQEKHSAGYGSTEGNIGNLKAIVTSPPWDNQEPSHAQGSKFEERHREIHPTKLAKDRPGIFSHEYGQSDGQLGNTSGESYWQAMEAVYDQCRQAIRPGGMLVVVIKDYVKGGKRVPLCDQTLELLESLGFTLVERIRAWVTKTTVHDGLFGEVVEKVERKSFFRRLAEKKGSPPIDWEEVICVITPCPNP